MYIERADGSRTDVADDIGGVGASNNGETLNIRLQGNYGVFAGDHVVVSYSGVTNPDAGEYEIVFTLNPQSDGTQSSDTLSIAENTSSTPTPTPTPTEADNTPIDDDATPTPTKTATPTDDTPIDDDATPTPTKTATPTDDAPTLTETATSTEANDDTATATPTDEAGGDDGGSDGDGAGFGAALAAVALLGAALLARR